MMHTLMGLELSIEVFQRAYVETIPLCVFSRVVVFSCAVPNLKLPLFTRLNRNGLDKSYVTFCHISLLFIVGEVLRSFLL